MHSSVQDCVMWHYPFIVEPLSPIGRQPAHAIVHAINQRFDSEVQPIIHMIADERIILSFPNHWEAVQAFRLADKGNTMYVNGVLYCFTIDLLQSNLMTVSSDQRIIVCMKGLDYAPDDTDSTDDLTTFTCLVCTQQNVLFPNSIIEHAAHSPNSRMFHLLYSLK